MKRRVLTMLLAGIVMTAAGCAGSAGTQTDSAKEETQEETEAPSEEAQQESAEETAPGETASEETAADGAQTGPASGVADATTTGGEDVSPEDAPDDGMGEDAPELTSDESETEGIGGPPGAAGEEDPNLWERQGAGLTFRAPDSFQSLKGVIEEIGNGETAEGSGVTYYAVNYIGISQDEYNELNNKASENALTQDDIEKVQKVSRSLFSVYSIDGNRTEDDLADYIEQSGLPRPNLEEIGKVEEYTFYFVDESTLDNVEDLGEYAEEYEGLAGQMDEFKSAITCFEPDPDSVQVLQ
ncbi:MAG: hypothetical protein IJG52_05640 [Lachnospiraceae bacterium]|nr:hypothetical protein [Lachnospiraceae bacterium]MBQ3392868.1 hypothetical protein [Lachnospiraceae bacterium]